VRGKPETLGVQMTSANRPFIPQDKPKSWVIFVLAGLGGLGVGLIGFGLRWLGFTTSANAAMVLFIGCWLVMAFAGLILAVRMLSGSYKDLQSKPWREQKW
jgi:hypothetical protein